MNAKYCKRHNRFYQKDTTCLDCDAENLAARLKEMSETVARLEKEIKWLKDNQPTTITKGESQ